MKFWLRILAAALCVMMMQGAALAEAMFADGGEAENITGDCKFRVSEGPKEKLTDGSVKVYLANTREEASLMAGFLQERGHTLFNFTAPEKRTGDEKTPARDAGAGWPGGMAYPAASEEYDRVAVLLDSSFRYDGTVLTCRAGGGLLAEKLLYQAVTRAREEVAVVVVGDEELFAAVQGILQGEEA